MSQATMKAPEGVTSASVAGVEYKVDGAGFIDASITHMAALIEHGFKQAMRTAEDEEVAEAAAEAEKKAQEEAAASNGDEPPAAGETDASDPAATAKPKKVPTK